MVVSCFNHVMTDRQDINIDELRKVLIARKEDLMRLRTQSSESRDAVELDQTRQGRLSRLDAMQQQEMAKEAERRREIDLKRINAALERIEQGDFGYCVMCEEEIAAKRLELDPAIPNCIACAAQT
jgi:DnaK suppressor protein